MKLPHPFPKPFPIPLNSLALLVLLCLGTWALLQTAYSVYWITPGWAFFPLFCWAERQEHKRMQRLHKGWQDSIRLWEERMNSHSENRMARRRAYMERGGNVQVPSVQRRLKPYETNWEDTLTA